MLAKTLTVSDHSLLQVQWPGLIQHLEVVMELTLSGEMFSIAVEVSKDYRIVMGSSITPDTTVAMEEFNVLLKQVKLSHSVKLALITSFLQPQIAMMGMSDWLVVTVLWKGE